MYKRQVRQTEEAPKRGAKAFSSFTGAVRGRVPVSGSAGNEVDRQKEPMLTGFCNDMDLSNPLQPDT